MSQKTRGRRAADPRRGEPLDAREMAVVRGVVECRTYRQIADDLGLGFETVKTYMARVRAKLGVTSRTAIAVWAVRREAAEGRREPRGGHRRADPD